MSLYEVHRDCGHTHPFQRGDIVPLACPTCGVEDTTPRDFRRVHDELDILAAKLSPMLEARED